MVARRIWPLMAVLAVTACASGPTPEQRKRLDALIGHTDVDVVRAFGVPTRTYQASGHLFLAYIDNQTEYYPGSMGWGWGWDGWGWDGPGWGGGGWGGGWGGPGWGYGSGFGPSYYNSVCQTAFELANGRVIGWTMRGDGC
ncbi:hypothetical protein GOB87_04010 [Acetobacter estunensis]|uniref:Lipoprotein n=1 Tax=Acetobacter estunensis TaxID=104097 RepID=A0A967B6J2_9PROT|nr:hypothetical protein [Acetobacter estunensis]NHO53126.1 hypothetical protein [Acetobacter estunensis]